MPYFQRFGTTDPEAYRPRSLRGYRSLRGPRSLPGQHRQNALDVLTELRHVVAQELLGLCLRDRTVLPEDLGRELDVRLRRGHLARIAEAQHRSETLLRDRRPDRTDRRADHRGGDVIEGVLP